MTEPCAQHHHNKMHHVIRMDAHICYLTSQPLYGGTTVPPLLKFKEAGSEPRLDLQGEINMMLSIKVRLSSLAMCRVHSRSTSVEGCPRMP